MADKLTELFNEATKVNHNVTDFVSFQAGFSKAAVSMRERAMKAVSTTDTKGMPKESALNKITNAIGQLSDIPN